MNGASDFETLNPRGVFVDGRFAQLKVAED